MSGFVCDVAAQLEDSDQLARAVRAAAARHPAAVSAFELDARDDASLELEFSLSEQLTFPNERLPAALTFERRGARMQIGVDGLSALDLHTLLAMCGTGRFSPGRILDELDTPVAILFEGLLERGILADGTPAPAPAIPAAGPGVTRLQHAGLLYRGRASGVLVDPHFHSAYEPDAMRGGFLRHQFEGLVDAILISHSHVDHFHLPTLMTFPRDLPIVVPNVPRGSLLCPDLAAILRAVGFRKVCALDGYDPPLSIGDLQVHAFPFYGEQPLRYEAPRHPDLRSYGNTYVVQHDSYTSWLLIDSGNDRAGCMADVAREVAARFGSIDYLISNLREFTPYTPLYITGAGHYWLALAADQIKRFRDMRQHLLTLGPDGVAEICEIARVRTFLPYAHWWGEPGEPAAAEEQLLLARLEQQLARRGAATRIVPWRIGESQLADRRAERSTADAVDEAAAAHQRRLLQQIRSTATDAPLSEAVARAFLRVPRHRFVRRYRSEDTAQWHELDERNLLDHLSSLYADRPLCLRCEGGVQVSSISQPSIVLRMLDMLRLEPGHVVFELGSGSGWNAALMAALVGDSGHVYSVELVAELAQLAAAAIAELGISNATIVAAEGGDGYAQGAPFDRAVFTAGAYDLPHAFYTQVRDGGLLLMVVKSEGGGDRLYVLEKKSDHFESIESCGCEFVSLQGSHHLQDLDPLRIDALPAWSELERREIGRAPFRWAVAGSESFLRRTHAIRCFLSIAEPMFRTFCSEPNQGSRSDPFFGLVDEHHRSLVIARDDMLVSYGTPHAAQRLEQRIGEWVALGMPSAERYRLAIYPASAAASAGPRSWTVKRKQSQLVWSLPQ